MRSAASAARTAVSNASARDPARSRWSDRAASSARSGRSAVGRGDARVPAPAIGLGQVVVDRVGDERVAEAVVAGHPGEHEQVVVDELADRSGQVRHVVADDGRQQVEVERAPDDRAGLGHGHGLRAAHRDARLDDGLERVRRTGGLDGPELGERQPAVVGQGSEELLDVERDAVGAGLDGLGDVGRKQDPGRSVMTAAIVAVSDALRRRRRISSARRWVTSRARHSRIGTRG